jgi:hypothetical protein
MMTKTESKTNQNKTLDTQNHWHYMAPANEFRQQLHWFKDDGKRYVYITSNGFVSQIVHIDDLFHPIPSVKKLFSITL